MAHEQPESDQPDASAPDESGAPAAQAEAPDPNDDLKARYRDALAHKQGSSGAASKGHGDAGSNAQSQNAGPTQRMFRRKSGG